MGGVSQHQGQQQRQGRVLLGNDPGDGIHDYAEASGHQAGVGGAFINRHLTTGKTASIALRVTSDVRILVRLALYFQHLFRAFTHSLRNRYLDAKSAALNRWSSAEDQ